MRKVGGLRFLIFQIVLLQCFLDRDDLRQNCLGSWISLFSLPFLGGGELHLLVNNLVIARVLPWTTPSSSFDFILYLLHPWWFYSVRRPPRPPRQNIFQNFVNPPLIQYSFILLFQRPLLRFQLLHNRHRRRLPPLRRILTLRELLIPTLYLILTLLFQNRRCSSTGILRIPLNMMVIKMWNIVTLNTGLADVMSLVAGLLLVGCQRRPLA